MRESFGRNSSANDSSLSLFKQSLFGKTVDICKSSIGIGGRRQSAGRPSSPQKLSERPSWENEILNEGKSSVYFSHALVMSACDSKFNLTCCAPSHQKPAGWCGQSGRSDDNLASERREYVCRNWNALQHIHLIVSIYQRLLPMQGKTLLLRILACSLHFLSLPGRRLGDHL
jgi:hypothetical protein